MVGTALAFATAVTVWSLLDRIAAHLPVATATVGGLLVGATLGRFKVLIMVPAAVIILAVGAATDLVGEAVVGVVAIQVGYVGAALAMAQRRTVSTFRHTQQRRSPAGRAELFSCRTA
jgi:hypothetical protein